MPMETVYCTILSISNTHMQITLTICFHGLKLICKFKGVKNAPQKNSVVHNNYFINPETC